MWRLPPAEPADEVLHTVKLLGAFFTVIPMDVTLRRGQAGGLQLYRHEGDLWVLPENGLPPLGAEALGQIQKFTPAPPRAQTAHIRQLSQRRVQMI